MITIPGYKIIKPIGQGGMASVYLATQESVGRDVAIKVMSPALSSDPSFSERFVKEARMASLVHPNIISVFDAGEIDGQNYIIMEYASGGNLDSAIKKGLSLQRISKIISEIANALHYSAAKGFIHRDVKPENILFREDGSAILVDFGIAKAISTNTKLTVVGSTIGSPNYMSPEQARGLPLDGRSDLYSLGIVLYEALTGAKPYDADDTFVIGLKHINDPVPVLPSEFQSFQIILNKLLAKEPDERFENGQVLIESLNKMSLQSGQVNASTDNHHHNQETANVATTYQQQETLEIPVDGEPTQIDDSTRIHSKQHVDNTRVKPQTNDHTVVKSRQQSRPVKENKKNTGLLIAFFLTFSAIAGGSVFYWQSQTSDTIETASAPPIEKFPAAEPNEKTKPEPSQPTTEEITIQDEITQLLADAQRTMEQRRFTTPEKDNAFYYYQEILSLDDNNKNAIEGIEKLAKKYLALATKQFNKKSYKSTLRFIDKGLFVEPDNNQLIALRDKTHTLQQLQKMQQTALFKDHKTPLRQDKNLTSIRGKHIGESSNEIFWFARQDLINRIYDQILKQCNNSSNAFNHADCEQSYERFIKQWPLPLVATLYKETSKKEQSTGVIVFDKKLVHQNYQALLNSYRKIFRKGVSNGFNNKADFITLANYDLHTSLAALLGIKTNREVSKSLRATFEMYRNKKVIKTIDDLSSVIEKMTLDQKVHLKPFTAKNSYEITPFSQFIHNSLIHSIDTENIEDAEYTLLGEYKIRPEGSYHIDLWLFDSENRIVDIQAVTLDANIADNRRDTPYLYNTSLFPKARLEKAYGFPTELSIGDQTANALLEVDQDIDLKVKLDDIGFYFIAVHVKRPDEEFSYLLPLHDAKIPFVQVTTRKNANKFITLGSFTITPPLGVEVLQLVASSVNLAKYLPDYEWDSERNQFIIKGSIGNIENGISAIRDKANTINTNSQKTGTLWQEKLLITSILEK